MKLDIFKKTTVGKIKRQFAAVYPFLKLEFFYDKHNKQVSTFDSIANDNTRLEKVQPLMREGCIAINDTMKVMDLEEKFKADHLLLVQVFRRSGNIWLETTMTDNWTLLQQNTHGKEITEHSHPAENSEDDFELMRDAG